MDAYSIILKPYLSEKAMNLMDQNNEICFVVKRSANKRTIKIAFEQIYEEKVERVNTLIAPNGEKIAHIKLVEPGVADEIGADLGMF